MNPFRKSTPFCVATLAIAMAAPATGVAGVPPAPTELTAEPFSGAALIQWQGDDAETFAVRRALVSGGPYERVAEVPFDPDARHGPRLRDEPLEGGTEYFYVVTSVNADGESEPSEEVSVVPWLREQVRFHMRPEGGREIGGDESRSDWVIGVEAPFEERVPVTVDVHLRSDVQPCPPQRLGDCSGEESFVLENEAGARIYGCADEEDNDDDGWIDQDDPDCAGVQGWSLSVVTGECFQISSATVRGTAGDFETRPPGRRSTFASFAITELVDPADNGGRQGAVSAIRLAFVYPVTLPPVSDEPVLRLSGSLSTEGLEEVMDQTTPCDLSIVEPGGDGLRGSDEPVGTSVIAWNFDVPPEIENAGVRLEWGASAAPRFQRGDVDTDGERELTDGIFTLNYLFLGGPRPPCLDAADVDDDGELLVSDTVYLLNHLFLGGPPPPAPLDCGVDPTEDDVSCLESADCV